MNATVGTLLDLIRREHGDCTCTAERTCGGCLTIYARCGGAS